MAPSEARRAGPVNGVLERPCGILGRMTLRRWTTITYEEAAMRRDENRILVPWALDLGLGPDASEDERREAYELLHEAELERALLELLEQERLRRRITPAA